MILLCKAKHKEKKKKKYQLDTNDYFLWRGKKHGSFRREICQCWLIASLEITVTVSISIWTFYPLNHSEA